MAEGKKQAYNSKWTPLSLYKTLEKMVAHLRKDTSILTLRDLFDCKEFINVGFNYRRWMEIDKKCEADDFEEVMFLKQTVMEILENRINTGALKNDLNASMAKLNLDVNFGWHPTTNVKKELEVKTPDREDLEKKISDMLDE